MLYDEEARGNGNVAVEGNDDLMDGKANERGEVFWSRYERRCVGELDHQWNGGRKTRKRNRKRREPGRWHVELRGTGKNGSP